MQTHTILLVDDEPQMRRVLRSGLVASGFEVIEARSGEEALNKLGPGDCDFVLLDLNLPGLDGIKTCRAIRAISDTPIIVVSVRGAERDKISALESGADDYVTKPFGIQELIARIHAVTRRTPKGEEQSHILVLGKVVIDFETHRVTSPKGEERLTPKEFELLRFMVSHPGQVLRHRRLLQAVWGPDYGNEVEYLRVFINQLRHKIEEEAHNPKFLLTEPWVGYRLALPPRP